MYAKQRIKIRLISNSHVLSVASLIWSIIVLEKTNNEFITDPVEKLEVFANYYQDVYTSLNPGVEEFLAGLSFPRIKNI